MLFEPTTMWLNIKRLPLTMDEMVYPKHALAQEKFRIAKIRESHRLSRILRHVSDEFLTPRADTAESRASSRCSAAPASARRSRRHPRALHEHAHSSRCAAGPAIRRTA